MFGLAPKAISGAFRSVGTLFTQDKEAKGQREHTEQMQRLQAQQAEFRAITNRTWMDSVADAANRLVRPAFSYTALSLWVAAIYRQGFTWNDKDYYVFLAIVGFWFGDRMLKGAQVRKRDHAIQRAKVENPPPVAVQIDKPPKPQARSRFVFPTPARDELTSAIV